MTVNPLVAGRLEGPTDPWAGVWIAEDIELIAQGVRNHSWVDQSLGAVGATLDGLAFVSDPLGALLQYGVAWLIEHVKPLRDALDWLAGDPAQISAHAQTWRNVATSLRADVTELIASVNHDIADWTGPASTAYRTWSQQQQHAIDGLAKAAEAMALMTEGAGFLIATVRAMVRDAIATVVSRLTVYAIEEAASLGLATPLIIEQVATLVASWAAKIGTWLRALLNSLRRLAPLVRRIGDLITELRSILGRLSRPGSQRPTPRATTPPIRTRPSRAPDPHAMPGGAPTRVHPTRPRDLGKREENRAAGILAKGGYDVIQNPPKKPNGKEPDYLVEQREFDCYAPTTDNPDSIRIKISEKLRDPKSGEMQADRIVLVLDNSNVDLEALRRLLIRRPLERLKEIILIKDGQIIPFFPFNED